MRRGEADRSLERNSLQTRSDLTDAAAVVDPSRFDELLDAVGPLGRSELMSCLVSDLSTVARDIDKALASPRGHPDRRRLRGAAHVLIALAGTVGAHRLRFLAVMLHRDASAANRPSLDATCAQTLHELDRLIGFCTAAKAAERLS